MRNSCATGVAGAAALLLLLLPAPALAHGAIQGVGEFYAGMLHPLIDPAPLIALLGLLIGQRDLSRGAGPLTGLATGLLTGAALAGLNLTLPASQVTVGFALLAGCAVALAREWPAWAVTLLSCGLGAAVGSGAALDGLAGGARWAALAGSVIGALLIFAAVAAAAARARATWSRTGLRVVGAWVVAGSVLSLVLALR